MRKKENGITLIALVITIIVLLILAGVAIAMLTGDNGILTKAKASENKTNSVQEFEKIKLSALAARINDNGEITITKERLKESLKENGFDLTDDNFKEKSNSYQYTGGQYAKYEISSKGEINSTSKDAIFYSDLEIGKKVNYTGYTAEGEQAANWYVYYADQKNVYLINKEGVNYTLKIKSKDGSISYAGISDLTSESLKDRFPAVQNGWLYNVTNKNNVNMKYGFLGVEYLLDSNNWSEYKGENADYVIGGTTAELMQESLKREREQKGDDIPELTINMKEEGGYLGYDLSISKDIPSNSVNYNGGVAGYVAASCNSDPKTYWDQKIWIWSYVLGITNFNNTARARPIVCLKSNTIFYEESDGTYSLKAKEN